MGVLIGLLTRRCSGAPVEGWGWPRVAKASAGLSLLHYPPPPPLASSSSSVVLCDLPVGGFVSVQGLRLEEGAQWFPRWLHVTSPFDQYSYCPSCLLGIKDLLDLLFFLAV